MRTLTIASLLLTLLANSLWSEGREDPLAKGAGRDLFYFSEGYYRAFLDLIGTAPFSPPNHDAVSVIGQVKKPGTIPFQKGLTASKAIGDRGGITGFAISRHVGVWKNKDGKFLIFDLKAVIDQKSGAMDPLLEEGDVVVVLEKRLNF